MKAGVHESRDVWKRECMKAGMHESGNVWKRECMKAGMYESGNAWNWESLIAGYGKVSRNIGAVIKLGHNNWLTFQLRVPLPFKLLIC